MPAGSLGRGCIPRSGSPPSPDRALAGGPVPSLARRSSPLDGPSPTTGWSSGLPPIVGRDRLHVGPMPRRMGRSVHDRSVPRHDPRHAHRRPGPSLTPGSSVLFSPCSFLFPPNLACFWRFDAFYKYAPRTTARCHRSNCGTAASMSGPQPLRDRVRNSRRAAKNAGMRQTCRRTRHRKPPSFRAKSKNAEM
jgi:hypothetical protein